MSKLRVFIGIAIILALILPAVIGSASCSSPPESITIGGAVSKVGWAPVLIAQQKGFFASNGLNVTLRTYETGQLAIDAVVNRQIDLDLLTEYLYVGRTFQEQDLSIIGSMYKADYFYVVGRKDHGIQNISDLKGKTVGLVRKGIGEFYLGRFLDLHGLRIADVTLSNIEPSIWVGAISRGDVDAIVVQDLYLHQIKEQIGDESVIWQVQNNQPVFGVISGLTDWIEQRSETIKRLLRAINQAEDYLVSHEGESKTITQKRFNLDDATVATSWPTFSFSLSLDLSLLVAMNDEARWMIDNNLTTEKTVPDFYDYIYTDGLKAVKPEAVGITK